jgi:hypothetical protein
VKRLNITKAGLYDDDMMASRSSWERSATQLNVVEGGGNGVVLAHGGKGTNFAAAETSNSQYGEWVYRPSAAAPVAPPSTTQSAPREVADGGSSSSGGGGGGGGGRQVVPVIDLSRAVGNSFGWKSIVAASSLPARPPLSAVILEAGGSREASVDRWKSENTVTASASVAATSSGNGVDSPRPHLSTAKIQQPPDTSESRAWRHVAQSPAVHHPSTLAPERSATTLSLV